MTINDQLPFLSGQKLFRVWLPGNLNKSGFVTDNSHIKMYDFFFLVWFSFQMPFTFSSSEIFNSILSCCLSHKASFTSTYCLLRQHLAFQSTLFALFLPTSPLRIFPFICYFSKTSQQKLLCYLLFYSPKDKANNFANVRISGMR